jgi:ABC-type multidrug transport system fused ATPase/permease subunit
MEHMCSLSVCVYSVCYLHRVFTYVDAQKAVASRPSAEPDEPAILPPSPPSSQSQSQGQGEEDPLSMSCYVDLSLSAQGGVSPISQLRKSSPDSAPAPLLSFRDVVFAYPSRPEHNCLKTVNVNIFNQSMTAITGTSGAGKSSMVALMCALYKPVSGELSLGGQLISACSDDDIKDWRQKVLTCGQIPWGRT